MLAHTGFWWNLSVFPKIPNDYVFCPSSLKYFAVIFQNCMMWIPPRRLSGNLHLKGMRERCVYKQNVGLVVNKPSYC